MTYHTANLQSCILYIYSTNIRTEYFKHGIYSPVFFSLQNAVCFIILTYLVPVLFTFYVQGVLKFKKKSVAKRLKITRLNWEGTYEFYCPVLYKISFYPPKCPGFLLQPSSGSWKIIIIKPAYRRYVYLTYIYISTQTHIS